MCMIIVNAGADSVDASLLADIVAANSDGAGLYRIESDTLDYFARSADAPLDWLADPDEPYVVHFRFVTAGSRAPKNLHPHPIPGTRSVLFHNGTVTALTCGGKNRTKGASDSRRLAALLGKADPSTWPDILDLAGPSRFVLVDRDSGTYSLHGPAEDKYSDGWIEYDDVLFSKCPYTHCAGSAWATGADDWADLTGKYAPASDASSWSRFAAGGDWDDPHETHAYPVMVYGTLLAGEGNARLLSGEGAALLGDCTTVAPHVLDISGAFPYMHRDPTGGAVVGELYRVDRSTLVALDALEGVPYHYTRERVTVRLGTPDGPETVVAEAYYPADGLPPVGDARGLSWRDAQRARMPRYRAAAAADDDVVSCDDCLALFPAADAACPSCGSPAPGTEDCEALLLRGA